MARVKREPNPTPRKIRPALTPEAREKQLGWLAYDLVEQRLLDGTASAQETVYFLKAVSKKAQTEQEILERQKDLITAKTEQIQSQKRIEELYTNAINAMKQYGGHGGEEEDYEDY